ncbi:MAG TPA: ATP-binding protein [Solirubrobacteraceae bacterium]|nr:ATP-binding protein [Solirubrobacteraceae bacterium]
MSRVQRRISGDLFPTDEPIPASQMIGRRADVTELAVALENGTSVILAGPRRTGKTSVCDAALTRVAGHGLYVAAVDLFDLADAAEFAEELAAAVLRNRPAIRKVLPKVRALGRSALSAAQVALVMKARAELGDGVELALEPGIASRDPDTALRDALELAQRVAIADDKRCVVFFDEFQELAGERKPYGDPDAVTKRMRAIFQRSSQVSYLFAGSLEHVMRDLFGPQDRAFSGFGSFLSLRPIAADDWREGLRSRFQSDECVIDRGALDRVVALGELHPRVTMLIAQRTHILSVILARREIDLALVEQGYDAAYHGDSALLDQLVDGIRSSHRLGLRLARRVAAGQTLTTGLHRGDADRALKKLLDIGVMERSGRGEYHVLNPLLRRRLLEPARL